MQEHYMFVIGAGFSVPAGLFPREEAVAEAQRILAQPEFMVKSIDEVDWKEIEEL